MLQQPGLKICAGEKDPVQSPKSQHSTASSMTDRLLQASFVVKKWSIILKIVSHQFWKTIIMSDEKVPFPPYFEKINRYSHRDTFIFNTATLAMDEYKSLIDSMSKSKSSASIVLKDYDVSRIFQGDVQNWCEKCFSLHFEVVENLVLERARMLLSPSSR